MTIKPLFDKVVVENLKAEEKTKSGLYLTSASQEKPATCLVVAVGPGGNVDGKDVTMQVKVGDVVDVKVLSVDLNKKRISLTMKI